MSSVRRFGWFNPITGSFKRAGLTFIIKPTKCRSLIFGNVANELWSWLGLVWGSGDQETELCGSANAFKNWRFQGFWSSREIMHIDCPRPSGFPQKAKMSSRMDRSLIQDFLSVKTPETRASQRASRRTKILANLISPRLIEFLWMVLWPSVRSFLCDARTSCKLGHV